MKILAVEGCLKDTLVEPFRKHYCEGKLYIYDNEGRILSESIFGEGTEYEEASVPMNILGGAMIISFMVFIGFVTYKIVRG